MDAPPQRLLRTHRQMDENAPFASLPTGKPLHSRFKSTPVLPSLSDESMDQNRVGTGPLLSQKTSNLTAIDPAVHDTSKSYSKPHSVTQKASDLSTFIRIEDLKFKVNTAAPRHSRASSALSKLSDGLESSNYPINKSKPKRATSVFRDTAPANDSEPVSQEPVSLENQLPVVPETNAQDDHPTTQADAAASDLKSTKGIKIDTGKAVNPASEPIVQPKSPTEKSECYSAIDQYNAALYQTELDADVDAIAPCEEPESLADTESIDIKQETINYNARLALEEATHEASYEEPDANPEFIPVLDTNIAPLTSLPENFENVQPDVLIPSLSQLTTNDSYIDPALRDYVLPDTVSADVPRVSTESFNRYAPVIDKPVEPEYVVAPEYPQHNDENVPPGGIPAPIPEAEYEYVEEEYDEPEGYTTAHSYFSHGGYTTSETTMLHDVQVTAKVMRELNAARDYVELNMSPDEIREELDDMSMVAEYSEEIFDHMRHLEDKMRVRPNYMDLSQSEVVWSMRAVLVDWMIQVHDRFGLLPETLFLSVNYMDRFLAVKNVSLGKLQLVGATALFIAAKFEEINIPGVQEMVFMVDKSYTIDEILKAERFMLMMLKFEMAWPGPMSFLRRISKADDYDLETRTLAKYFLEVTLVDERFVSCVPSLLAAAAHCLSRVMLRKGNWGYAHVHYSQYTYDQLRPLMRVLVDCCTNATTHHKAVYEKYTDRKFKRAALYVEGELRKGFTLPHGNDDYSRWCMSTSYY